MTPDQKLEDAAQAMVRTAEMGRPVMPVLKALCPAVDRQVTRDKGYPGLLALWGRSLNVDENTAQVIVHPAILHAIGELAGVPMDGRVVHAGLQHTYGYLFSQIETPYGAKRDRWVSTNLERGFALDRSLLGEQPREGTLLANLTSFIGRIVFRDRMIEARRLEENAAASAVEIRDYDYTRLQVCRVTEHAALPGAARREVFLVTDLVPFPIAPADGPTECALLIYSVQDGPQASLQLITAFPVGPDAVRAIEASVNPDGTAEVRARYNAHVPGLEGQTVSGHCFFGSPPAQN
jgi:hypothetical protein